jgi:hypothetical protein
MKVPNLLTGAVTLLVLAVNQEEPAYGQSATFTYQGRLTDHGSPANGAFDLRFTLYDALSGGSAVGGPVTNSPAGVTNGLFAAVLDFGTAPFSSGAARWLEIGVRTNGSSGSFTILTPRQPITAAPYAVTAANLTGNLPAGHLAGALPSSALSGNYSGAVTFSNDSNSFSGSFIGNGNSLTNLNGAGLLNGSVGPAALPASVLTALSTAALTNSAQAMTNLLIPGYVWQFQRTPVFEVNTYYVEGCAPNSGRVMHYITNLAGHPKQVANGYDLVAIDDGWQAAARDANGDLTWNTATFSNSMPALANMAHTNGLRLGIYTAAGPTTCCTKPGSTLENLYRDIQKFMSWGCDEVRIDECDLLPYFNVSGLQAVMRLSNQAVADFNNTLALGAAKRGLVLEIVMNNGYWTAPALALGEAAFESNVLAVRADTGDTFAEALTYMRPVLSYASLLGPGHTGPILQLGNARATTNVVTLGAMTLCGFSTPDVLPDLDLNTNQEVYAIYRDPQVRPASIAWSNALTEVWVRDLDGADTHALALINADSSPRTVTLTAPLFGAGSSTVYNVRDVWNHANLAVFQGTATYTVAAASAKLLKLSPAQTSGMMFLTSDTATNSTAYPNGTLAIAGGKLWVLENGTWVAK